MDPAGRSMGLSRVLLRGAGVARRAEPVRPAHAAARSVQGWFEVQLPAVCAGALRPADGAAADRGHPVRSRSQNDRARVSHSHLGPAAADDPHGSGVGGVSMFAYSSAIFVDFISGSITTFEQ